MWPQITKEELINSPWREAVSMAKEEIAIEYSQVLFEKSKEFRDDSSEYRALHFLGLITTLMPDDKSPCSFCNLRTEEFDDNLIEIIFSFINEIDNDVFISHMAHILWFLKKKYKFESAKLAIDSYKKIFENMRHIDSGMASRMLLRAANIALELGKGGKSLFDEILKIFESFICSIQKSEVNGLHCDIFELVVKYGDVEFSIIQDKCQEFSTYFESEGNVTLAEEFLHIKKRNIQRKCPDDPNLIKQVMIQEAEMYIRWAEKQSSSSSSAVFFNNALNIFREIGERDKAEAIHCKLIEAQSGIISEMKTNKIEIPSNEEIINKAYTSVSNKSCQDALTIMSFMPHLPDENRHYEEAKKLLNMSITNYIANGLIVNEKGKTVAKISPSGMHAHQNDAISYQMSQIFSLHVIYNVLYIIIPSVQSINSEHLIDYKTISYLTHNNYFIPPNHEEQYTRGLVYGFRGDYEAACLFLIPQIENSIRFVMEKNGKRTSTCDSSGIQKERDLNDLLDDEWVKNYFGQNMIYTLTSALTKRPGPNFRNLMAHGLLNDMDFKQPIATYVWWLICRLLISIAINPEKPSELN